MIAKIQPIDPENLGKKESSSKNAYISQGTGNRVDFVGELGSGGNKSGRDELMRGDGMKGEDPGSHMWNWWIFVELHRSLMQ